MFHEIISHENPVTFIPRRTTRISQTIFNRKKLYEICDQKLIGDTFGVLETKSLNAASHTVRREDLKIIRAVSTILFCLLHRVRDDEDAVISNKIFLPGCVADRIEDLDKTAHLGDVVLAEGHLLLKALDFVVSGSALGHKLLVLVAFVFQPGKSRQMESIQTML